MTLPGGLVIHFGNIRAEQHPRDYKLRIEVEALADFLSSRFLPSSTFDAIKFIVEEICINGTPKAHIALLFSRGVKEPGQLNPMFKELYDHLARICIADRNDFREAKGYLMEKLAATAIEFLSYGQAKTDFVFFEGSKRIKGGHYTKDGTKHFHDQVDVLCDGRKFQEGKVYLGECKNAAGSFRGCLDHIHTFYSHLAQLVEKSSKTTTEIVFFYAQDVGKYFPELLSEVPRSRLVFSLSVREWKKGLTAHAL